MSATDLQLCHELPRLRVCCVKMAKSEEEQPDVDDEEGFRTPTSKESKIPPMLTCPPAPRRKRKIPEPDGEMKAVKGMVSKEELEDFFRSVIVHPKTPKKRCRCCRCIT